MRYRIRVAIALLGLLVLDWAPGVPPLPWKTAAGQGVPCQDFLQATATCAGNAACNAQAAGKAGAFFYPVLLEAQMIANAAVAGAAGPAGTISTVGLTGNLAWLVDNSSLTIGQQREIMNIAFTYGTMRTGAPNNNFQLSYSGGGQSTYNIRLNIVGCYGP